MDFIARFVYIIVDFLPIDPSLEKLLNKNLIERKSETINTTSWQTLISTGRYSEQELEKCRFAVPLFVEKDFVEPLGTNYCNR